MEGKIGQESVSKISISKIRKHFSDEGYKSEDFVISPLIQFKSMEGTPRIIEGGVTVGIICNGTAKVVINGRSYELRKDHIFLLNEESIISNFKCSKACMGYLITYSRSFVDSINIDVADYMNARLMFSLMPCISVSEIDIERLHGIAALLSSSIVKGDFVYRDRVVVSLFSAFFYTLTSILSQYAAREVTNLSGSRGDKILSRFMVILSEECEREHSVEYYARRLGITPKYLSLICKQRTGRNASKVIDEAVVRKAKMLLKKSGLSILEVSQRLNFVSQSFFGKYFKQRVGISPSRYKATIE